MSEKNLPVLAVGSVGLVTFVVTGSVGFVTFEVTGAVVKLAFVGLVV